MKKKIVLLIRFFCQYQQIFAQNYCHNLEVFEKVCHSKFVLLLLLFHLCVVVLFSVNSIRFDSFESLALSFIRSQNIVCHLDMCDSVRDSNGVNRIIAINVDFVVYAYGFCGILDILLLPCAVVFVFTFYFRSFCYVM